jgi:hypothetical protein
MGLFKFYIMNITFLTTTTFSDVQEVQSSCIKKFFPESKHYLIDGRRGWFKIWYKWLEIANNIDSDWYIHIDEDCFVTSEKEIMDLIKYMVKNNYDIAGSPDGCHEYRSGNHMAFNSFFMIMNRKCIETWVNRKELPQFKEEWIEEYPFTKNNTSTFNFDMTFGSEGPFKWYPGTEPYYDFMWVLKDNGIKFKYLEPLFGKELQTTNLLNDTVIHMWHQRERHIDRIVSSAHTIPNKQRYDLVIEKIKNIINE